MSIALRGHGRRCEARYRTRSLSVITVARGVGPPPEDSISTSGSHPAAAHAALRESAAAAGQRAPRRPLADRQRRARARVCCRNAEPLFQALRAAVRAGRRTRIAHEQFEFVAALAAGVFEDRHIANFLARGLLICYRFSKTHCSACRVSSAPFLSPSLALIFSR